MSAPKLENSQCAEVHHDQEDISVKDKPSILGAQSMHIPKKVPESRKLTASEVSKDVSECRLWKARARHALHGIVKFIAIGGMLSCLLMAVFSWPSEMVYDQDIRNHTMSALFLLGLLTVAIEDIIGINKSAIVLLLAATLWTILAVGYNPLKSETGAHELHHGLNHGLQDVGSVLLFLLPAMGLVEAIDHFEGFQIVTISIQWAMAGKTDRLMPIILVLTFFLSSFIDNLTSTIVAIKILRHISKDDEERKRLGGLVVIAANAGGAWSPIGDVTTTMLWIQGKITAPKTVAGLFLPSIVSGLLPLVGVYCAGCQRFRSRRKSDAMQTDSQYRSPQVQSQRSTSNCEGKDEDLEEQEFRLEEEPLQFQCELGESLHDDGITQTKVLSLAIGLCLLLLVPVLKMWTGLPPYLGMLLALGLMWLISDLLRFDATPKDGKHHGVIAALYKVDLTGLLFFTGILLSVGALDSAGVLHAYATMLANSLGQSPVALCTLLGLSSAVVDNVPLVEASIDMFKEVETDDRLWQLIALAAGTGGSILSVGSIAGVTLMSMEEVGFLWYVKRISVWAFLGFISGIAMYELQYVVTGG
jgi:Na+/H+ antiporter NhaD/arsenite permease-like protein